MLLAKIPSGSCTHGALDIVAFAPKELALIIFSKLPDRDLAIAARISKLWRAISTEDSLWERLAQTLSQHLELSPLASGNYRNQFMKFYSKLKVTTSRDHLVGKIKEAFHNAEPGKLLCLKYLSQKIPDARLFLLLSCSAVDDTPIQLVKWPTSKDLSSSKTFSYENLFQLILSECFAMRNFDPHSPDLIDMNSSFLPTNVNSILSLYQNNFSKADVQITLMGKSEGDFGLLLNNPLETSSSYEELFGTCNDGKKQAKLLGIMSFKIDSILRTELINFISTFMNLKYLKFRRSSQ